MNLEHDCNAKASVMGITMTEFVCWGTSTASESEDRSESRKLSSTPGTAWYINCIPFYANSSWNCQAAACLSVCARMSTILQLWTATIFIVVVFILYLSIQRRRRTKSTCWVFGLAPLEYLMWKKYKNRGRAVVTQHHTVNRLHCRWFVTGKVVRYLHT